MKLAKQNFEGLRVRPLAADFLRRQYSDEHQHDIYDVAVKTLHRDSRRRGSLYYVAGHRLLLSSTVTIARLEFRNFEFYFNRFRAKTQSIWLSAEFQWRLLWSVYAHLSNTQRFVKLESGT